MSNDRDHEKSGGDCVNAYLGRHEVGGVVDSVGCSRGTSWLRLWRLAAGSTAITADAAAKPLPLEELS